MSGISGSSLPKGEVVAKLLDGEVSLDWSLSVEADRGGRALVVTTANLIVRYCPNVRILPQTDLGTRVAGLLRAIDSSARPEAAPNRTAVRLVVGGASRLRTSPVVVAYHVRMVYC